MTARRLADAMSRVLIAVALLPVAWAAWLMTGGPLRMLCGVGCLWFTGLAGAFAFGDKSRAFIVTGLAVAVLAISPVEVALAVRHGRPGIVPVLRGLPGSNGLERARRGEVVLAGCMVTGFEPRWVVIW
jgi:hypothetical protein